MRRADGTTLLVAVLLSTLLFRSGRAVLPHGEDRPVFYGQKPGYVTVYLGHGFRIPGFYHFFDGVFPEDVIQMAVCETDDERMALWHPSTPLRQGECLEVFCENGQVAEVVKDFIPAGQRITLGIPLHPDRMKDSDWQALPGIGPRLADRIIKDRQKNGDFGGLQALQRVPGIGPGTVKRLEKFF